MATSIELRAKANEKVLSDSIVQGVKSGAKRSSPILINAQIKSEDFKKFKAPLGRISSDLNQFQSSLDASIARVLAFGASASILAGVTSGFKALLETSIEVEKSLADINVILNLTASQLNDFSSELFGVARNTAQAFSDVTIAATELARQGLGASETLKRLNDSLILARLSGLDANKSVETLTASINGFNAEGLKSTEIVNRLAAVDAAFAVSTQDLANGLARAGAVSQDAGVSFNELLAAITAVQQSTARGGSVIGNGFKTIFTRIQRSNVRETLEGLGVATSDANGEFRGAIDILTDYAKVYETLSDSVKASTAEQIAGVFQINTLKAFIKDLNKEYSIYSGALNTANGATDEATRRNEELNKTTAALIERTKLSAQEFGNIFADLTLGEGLTNVLTIIDSIASKLTEVLDPEKGNSIARAFLGGIGDFIAGPGLVIIGKTFFKLISFLGKEVVTAIKQINNLSVEKQKQQQIETAIGGVLKNNNSLLAKIVNAEGNRKLQQELILGGIKEQEVALKSVLQIQQAISRAAASGKISLTQGKPFVGKAGGYVPNFAQSKRPANKTEEFYEKMSAKSVGYNAGRVYKTKIYDGQGGSFDSVVNSAEDVKTIIGPNGKKGTYVINPLMAAKGFVPNFAGDVVAKTNKSKTSLGKKFQVTIPNEELRIGAIVGIPKQGEGILSTTNTSSSIGTLTSPQARLLNKQFADDSKISIVNLPVAGIPGNLDENKFRGKINQFITPGVGDFAKDMFKDIFKDDSQNLASAIQRDSRGGKKLLDKGTEGGIFEAALRLAANNAESFTSDSNESSPFDFEENREAGRAVKNMFKGYPGKIDRADAKRTANSSNIRSLINKSLNLKTTKEVIFDKIRKQTGEEITGEPPKPAKRPARRKRNRAADGYIPNFAIQNPALNDAIEREKNAGIPESKIRISRSSRLINYNNPNGLAVTNTEDEPRALEDVPSSILNKAAKSSVTASGYVPNFAKRAATEGLSINVDKVNSAFIRLAKNATVNGYEMDILSKKLDLYNNAVAKGRISLETYEKGVTRIAVKTKSTEKNLERFSKELIRAQTATRNASIANAQSSGELGTAFSLLATTVGYTVANQLQQSENRGVRSAGEGLSAGVSAGFTASIAISSLAKFAKFAPALAALGGPITIAIGLITGLGVALFNFYDKSKRLKEEFEKISSEFTEAQDSTSKYLSLLSELDEANKSGDTSRVTKLRQDLGDAFTDLPTELKPKLLNAGKEASITFIDSFISELKNRKKEAGEAVEIEEIFPGSGGGRRTKGETTDRFSEKQKDFFTSKTSDLFSSQEKIEKGASELSEAVKRFGTTSGDEIFNKLLLSRDKEDRSKLATITGSSEAFVQEAVSDSKARAILVKLFNNMVIFGQQIAKTNSELKVEQENLTKQLSKTTELQSSLNNASSAALKTVFQSIQTNVSRLQFGNELLSITKDFANFRTELASSAGYLSSFSSQASLLQSDNEIKKSEQELSSRKLFSDFIKQISSTDFIKNLSPDFSIEDFFEVRKGKKLEDVSSPEFKFISDLANKISERGSLNEEEIKEAIGKAGELSDDGKIKEELTRLLTETRKQTDEIFKQTVAFKIGQLKLIDTTKQALVNRLSGQSVFSSYDDAEKSFLEIRDLFRGQVGGMSTTGPSSEMLSVRMQAAEVMRNANSLIQSVSGTETVFSDLFNFATKTTSLISNASQLSQVFGLGRVPARAESGRQLSQGEQLNIIAKQSQDFLTRNQKQIDQSATRVASGEYSSGDLSNIGRASVALGLQEAVETQIKNQRRLAQAFQLANQDQNKYLTQSEKIRRAEQKISQTESIAALYSSLETPEERKRFNKYYEQSFGRSPEGLTREELQRDTGGASSSELSKFLANFSMESTDQILRGIGETLTNIETILNSNTSNGETSVTLDFGGVSFEGLPSENEVNILKEKIEKFQQELKAEYSKLSSRIDDVVGSSPTGR